MSCLSRITKDTHVQYFGNGRNKFYVEFRCTMPCAAGSKVCHKCAQKSDTCKVQTSRTFPHGTVEEPIPDSSHLFGGKWYQQGILKYGPPSQESIQIALDHQRRAREGVESFVQPPLDPPPKKKSAKGVTTATAATAATSAATETEEKSPETKERKPKKSRQPSIKVNPYGSLIQNTPQLVYKEVSLPTHIETNSEEIDTDDMEVEYVTLKPFEWEGTSYFRDHAKNKLYKNVKNKIGEYVGRYHPTEERIDADVPDSDDES